MSEIQIYWLNCDNLSDMILKIAVLVTRQDVMFSRIQAKSYPHGALNEGNTQSGDQNNFIQTRIKTKIV